MAQHYLEQFGGLSVQDLCVEGVQLGLGVVVQVAVCPGSHDEVEFPHSQMFGAEEQLFPKGMQVGLEGFVSEQESGGPQQCVHI